MAKILDILEVLVQTRRPPNQSLPKSHEYPPARQDSANSGGAVPHPCLDWKEIPYVTPYVSVFQVLSSGISYAPKFWFFGWSPILGLFFLDPSPNKKKQQQYKNPTLRAPSSPFVRSATRAGTSTCSWLANCGGPESVGSVADGSCNCCNRFGSLGRHRLWAGLWVMHV